MSECQRGCRGSTRCLQSCGESAADRAEAAQLLWAARAAVRDEAQDEAVDWAFAAVPDSVVALCLKVRSLIGAEDLELAESLLVTGLLQRPEHAGLLLLHCECLLRQCRTDEAHQEMERLIARRATHVRTLRVAAEIATARGEHASAVAILRKATSLRRRCDATREQLVQALLAAGDAETAESQAMILLRPSPLLMAEIYIAQQRYRDAIDVLGGAIAKSQDGSIRNDAIVAMARLLESIGDLPALRRLIIDQEGNDSPRVRVEFGRVLLTLGQFHRAKLWVTPLVGDSQVGVEALRVLVVAATLGGKTAEANRFLVTLRERGNGEDGRALAELWRRGLLGRALTVHEGSRRAGADASALVLPGFMRESVSILTRELHTQSARLTAARRTELENHRAACIAALGDWQSGSDDAISAGDTSFAKPSGILRLATHL